MAKYCAWLFIIACLCILTLMYYKNSVETFLPTHTVRYQTPLNGDALFGKVDLTVRLTLNNTILTRFLCDLLRSLVVYWNPKYGDVILILDAKDRMSHIGEVLQQVDLQHSFRLVYEEPPKRVAEFQDIAMKHKKSSGYYQMLYSSFLMDTHTNRTVIAWTDTDVILTTHVSYDTVARHGKLLVKGVNTFDRFNWVPEWDHSTVIALGFNMPMDFMTYFPVYVYASTIRKCRQHIMKRLGTKDFEEAFLRIAFRKVSPVNIIMSYAYYFQRDLYEWHFDTDGVKLGSYNERRLPQHPIRQEETTPMIHTSVHSRYYNSTVHPLQRAICYTQMHLQHKTSEQCDVYRNLPHLQLFEFQTYPRIAHVGTWCGGERRRGCVDMISEHYRGVRSSHAQGNVAFDINLVTVAERFARKECRVLCPHITYHSFK